MTDYCPREKEGSGATLHLQSVEHSACSVALIGEGS